MTFLHLVTHALMTFLEAYLHVQSMCFNGRDSVMKKAFSMSVAKAIWLIRKVNRILGSSCIRLGPLCRQSLRLNAVGDFFTDVL